MKYMESWNRRDFIRKPLAWLASSYLFSSFSFLFGQGGKGAPATFNAQPKAEPITRKLGKTGITLPIVSMGVMNADIPGLVPRSYELGIRHFDTAAVYQQGRNEEMVGRMIKEMGVRDQVIISTKIGRPGRRREQDAESAAKVFTPAEVKAHFNDIFAGSLKRLQMDHVDILYNHGADSEADVNSSGAIEALTALKKEGKTRFIGVSSHRPEMVLKQAIKLGVYDVVLIPINYTMAANAEMLKLIDAAAKQGIGIVAMKTQAGGARRPDPKLGKPLTPTSQTALLKWVLQHEAITTAIPGYTTYEQLEQNFSVASNLAYSPEEREFLSDKRTVADAQFCQQCGQCKEDCPSGVDIPQLMRSHMYAVQYSNRSLAVDTAAGLGIQGGLSTCSECAICKASCRNHVNIAQKIADLQKMWPEGVLTA